MTRHHSSRGVALLTALLITALVTVIAVGMASRQQLDIRRTGNVLDSDQAYLYALSIESWAQGALGQDLIDDNKDPTKRPRVDALTEAWAEGLESTDVEGGKVAGSIGDMQGLFNVNNLAQPVFAPTPENPAPPDPSLKDKQIFERLLSIVGEVDRDDARIMVEAVADWLDADDVLRLNGAEEQEYLRLTPPYRAANAPLASISELLLIRGFTPQIYERIAPFVCALPVFPTLINVNTAPPQVLAALADGMDSRAEGIVQVRESRVFVTAAQFVELIGAQLGPLVGDKVTVTSDFFLLSGSALAGRAQVQLYSLLQRSPLPPPSPAKPHVKVIMRSQGTY